MVGRTVWGVKPYAILAAVIAVAAGALFAASAATSGGQDIRAQTTTQLRDLVIERQHDLTALEGQVTDLQAKVDDLSAEQAADPQVAAARERIDRVAAAAGATEVTGSGVRVTLDDAPKSADSGEFSPDDLVVHQQDVQAVVNALWRGGASAMEIMDQRVISTSAVRCVGNTLILQGRVYSPPFAITALGDQSALHAALADDPQVTIYRGWADLVGLGYSVEDLGEVTLPAYEGAVDLSWAKPSAA